MDDVGIKGSARRVIKRTDSFKDTRKQISLNDEFAKGAKPKTVSGPEAPTAEAAPKLGDNSSEEVVVGPKETQ